MEIKVSYINDTDIKLVRPNGALLVKLRLQTPVHKEQQAGYARLIETWMENAEWTKGKKRNPWQQLEYLNRCMQRYSTFPNSFVRLVTDKELDRVYLGTQLRQLREKRDVSMRALAQMSGIDYGNLSKIETGKVSVGYDILCRLLQTLDAIPELIPKMALDKDKLKGQ